MNCTLKECPMFDALLTGTHIGDDPANCCIVYGDPVNCRLLKLYYKQETHDKHIIGRLEGHKADYRQELDNPDSRKSSEYINGVVIGLGIAISEIEEQCEIN
ncbi:MAG: hypothetical protein ABIJ40_00110 [Bacteroidota bacterium]